MPFGDACSSAPWEKMLRASPGSPSEKMTRIASKASMRTLERARQVAMLAAERARLMQRQTIERCGSTPMHRTPKREPTTDATDEARLESCCPLALHTHGRPHVCAGVHLCDHCCTH